MTRYRPRMYWYESDGRASSCIPKRRQWRVGAIVSGIRTSVVVPLEVRDRSRVGDPGDSINDEVLYFRKSNIQNELIARHCSRVLSCMQNPVRVLIVQRRVKVGHLGFDPDSEFDSSVGAVVGTCVYDVNFDDLIDVGLQAVGEFGGVGLMVVSMGWSRL